MFSKLFSSRKPAAVPTASVPEGLRIYAIGDIHGRLDLLDELLTAIAADDSARAPAKTHVIFLGDLIDRGPSSAQVVERLRQFDQQNPGTHFLLGNHEEVFLKALSGDRKALSFFVRIGGRETVLSYGVSEEAYLQSDFDELFELLIAHVPPAHIAFLERFEDLITFGDYAFVHAGVRPGEPLANQRTSDLRWIRDEFLNHTGTLEKIVVHGHSIAADVEVAPHRIGLDTGAFASGKLSAMAFEGDRRWILQTNGMTVPDC